MLNEESVLIKVDKETKDKMRELNINWSEELRRFIKERIRKKKNMALAVALNDRLLAVQNLHKTDTTAVIRRFRDARYGANRS
ncbi:MAG: hypothetical protein KGI00_04205 [Candidatus Micrarchaeota archaeon]|nr:hypothetical protein [Candidatus Micrarchaeota archaeon]MDE1824130.1 hypothetical protein [Candidatus Micrarchaeota archaeon]MDE1849903.1 hypothetical protein [Candidatus Micrarchaeota archaeon]